jgi:hypothetical protein
MSSERMIHKPLIPDERARQKKKKKKKAEERCLR